MERIRISVVVPTYRRPALLLRCIESLQRQQFPDEQYEIIIVSDGEDPDTNNSLAQIPSRKFPLIHYYSLPGKAGPAAARNFGCIMAQGPLVVFTDDDCVPDVQWLRSMWRAYSENSLEEIAFSGKTVVPIADNPTDYEKNISQLASAEFITANCACTKKAIQRVGGFDERFRMAWREDSDLQFKFIVNSIPIIKVNDAVVTHPVRKAAWGVSIKEERKGMFNALLYKKFPTLYKEKIQPNPPWHYYAVAFFLILMVTGFLTDKNFPKVTGLAGWLLMTAWFTWKRLNSTSHSLPHVTEMAFTSAVIPVLSLFWKFYGSWKFRVLLIP
jgi:glycosyltransferase involved in cell wall biosynthesis